MPLHDDIAAALAGIDDLRLEARSGSEVGARWTAGGRRRGVVLRRAGDVLIVDAPVCGEGSASAREVLLHAATLGGGAIALLAGWYVVRHVRAAAVDAATLRAAILGASDAAERFRARLVRRERAPAVGDAVFVHYGT
jgi:hypothetical protein